MGNLADSKNKPLPGFQQYLPERKLVPEKNAPYFAHWVSRYLHFARRKEISSAAYDEAGVLEFLEELRADSKTLEWQPRQADDAIQLYYVHFLGQVNNPASGSSAVSDVPGVRAVAEAGIRSLPDSLKLPLVQPVNLNIF